MCHGSVYFCSILEITEQMPTLRVTGPHFIPLKLYKYQEIMELLS